MQPHEERVVQEHKDLAEKITKLEAFLQSKMFHYSINDSAKNQLLRQRDYMVGYRDVLAERIENFA